jgi:hypothetical protein
MTRYRWDIPGPSLLVQILAGRGQQAILGKGVQEIRGLQFEVVRSETPLSEEERRVWSLEPLLPMPLKSLSLLVMVDKSKCDLKVSSSYSHLHLLTVMSYPSIPHPYGSYQGQSQPYQSSHYPNQYPSVSVPTFPLFPQPPSVAKLHNRASPDAVAADRPDLTGVSHKVASQSIRRLISGELRDAGFVGAQPGAMSRLEHEVIACWFALFDDR